MSDILPYKTAIILIKPFFDLQDKPKDIYDKLIPDQSGREYIANFLLRYSRLNATIVEADTIGQCLWINNNYNCTGIMKMVMENEVEGSLLYTPLDAYQSGDLLPKLTFGSFVTDFRRVFMSTPQVEARNATLNPFNITNSIPWSVLLIDFILLLTSIAIINNKLNLRDKRISFFEVVLMHTFRLQRNFQTFHRKLMFLFIILYCFFIYSFISNSMSSDLVVDIPAKYLNSLQDIIDSNRTPALFGGFGLLEDFGRSQTQDRFVKKEILRRIRERNSIYDTQTSSNAAVELKNRLLCDNFVLLFERDYFVGGTKNLICMTTTSPETIPKLKVSKPFDQEIMGFYYSSKINKEVARRITMTDTRIHESGQFLSESIPDDLLYCRLTMEETQVQEKEEIKMPFVIFELPLKCLTFAFIICFSVFIIELFKQ